MEKKKFVMPEAERVSFTYKDQVVASNNCHYTHVISYSEQTVTCQTISTDLGNQYLPS